MKKLSGASLHLVSLLSIALGAPGIGHAQLALDTSGLTGVPLVKTIHTMRDARYKNIVQQQFDFSCGSAALSTLLRYGYGIDIPEREMIRRMMVFSTPQVVIKNGFSMLDMKNFVETIGLRGRGYRVTMAALYELRIPVIVLMDIKGYLHFVVLKGAKDGRVFIADPALGNRVVLEQDFVKSWNGLVLAVIGKPLKEDSPLLRGIDSPALRLRQSTLQTSTTPIPLSDFGMIRADLF